MSRTRHSDLAGYYGVRGAEHDRIYDRPDRQQDLLRLREILSTLLAGRHVLELACGTGYWTQYVAQVARSILGLDVHQHLLDIAASRLRSFSNCAFLVDDALTLTNVAAPSPFDASLAAFWWSHVPRESLAGFLKSLHDKLRPGALVVFADNRNADGHPFARTDEQGNTYEHHILSDGSEHEILTNFPTAAELREILEPQSRHLMIHELQHYWCASYQIT